MFDCVIQHGSLIATPDLRKQLAEAGDGSNPDLIRADIGILDGKIAAIGQNLHGRSVIAADDRLVIPGGVDPHVHLEMNAGALVTSDTWATGSRAAALGGTTTVIDFVEPAYAHQPLMEAFQQRLEQASGACAVDFNFHMTLCDADEATLQQIPAVMSAGMPSFKLYTTYEGFRLEDESLLLALEAIGQSGGLAMVHAESDAIIAHATRRLQAAGRLTVRDFPQSRPALAEVEAIKRVLLLAKYTGAPVYIAHISTQAGAAALASAHQSGQAAWGETCPQYLLLDQSLIQTEDFSGARFVCCPPLRSPADGDALWRLLQNGGLQTIGTDHCAFNYAGQKDLGQSSFLKIPAGLPGIELRLALTYTYGVAAGRISHAQWVDLCCTAPARLFGLHPRKGELCIGADADIVLFDPRPRGAVAHARLHEAVDYTPYEGMALVGAVDTTLLRGQVLVRGGQWVGESGSGLYISGKDRIDEGKNG